MAKTDRGIRRLEKEIKRELAQNPTGERLRQLRIELDDLLRKLREEKPPPLTKE